LKRIRLPSAVASRADDLRSAVEDERRKNGSSFGTGWNRVKATKPELFDNLDLQAKDLAELNEIEQGDSYTPHVEPTPAGRVPNNVPDIPGAKPTGQRADDPRAKGFPHYLPRPRDPRIQGVAVR